MSTGDRAAALVMARQYVGDDPCWSPDDPSGEVCSWSGSSVFVLPIPHPEET